MATQVSRLSAVVSLRNKGWIDASRGVVNANRKTSQSLDHMRRNMRTTGNAAVQLQGKIRTLATNLGVLLGAGAIVAATRNVITFGDEMAKAARRVDVTAETMQGLQYAAESVNVPIRKVEKSLNTLAVRVARLGLETSSFRTELEDLAPELISQFQATRSNEEALRLLARAIGDTKTRTDALALSQAAFGQGAATALLQIIGEQGKGIQESTRQLERMNALMDNETANAMENANQTITNFARTLKVLLASALAAAIEQVNKLAAALLGLEYYGPNVDTEGLDEHSVADRIKGANVRIAELRQQIEKFNSLGAMAETRPEFITVRAEFERARERLEQLYRIQKTLRRQVQEQRAEAAEADAAAAEAVKLYRGSSLVEYASSLKAAARLLREAAMERRDALIEFRRIQQLEFGGPNRGVLQELGEFAGRDISHLSLDTTLYRRLAENRSQAVAVLKLQAEMAAEWERIDGLIQSQADTISKGITSALTGAKSAAQAFGDVMQGVLDSIIARLVSEPIANFLVSAISSFAGAHFGGAPGGGIGPAGGPIPGRAAGGAVGAGRSYLVGERGPEIFTPAMAGSIGTGGGSPIHITVNGVQDPTIVQNEIRRSLPLISKVIEGQVVAKQRLPGQARKQTG